MKYPWEPEPCEKGHVFIWTSTDTAIKNPPEGTPCQCGAVSYPDTEIRFFQRRKDEGEGMNELIEFLKTNPCAPFLPAVFLLGFIVVWGILIWRSGS